MHKIIFLHIPKCGGTSVHNSLASIYNENQINQERHNRLLEASRSANESQIFFSGHFCFFDAKSMLPDFKLVTIFRDPRARLVSMYNFLRAHRLNFEASPTFRLHYLANVYQIEDFFSLHEVRRHPAVMNGMTRVLSNQRSSFYRWEESCCVPQSDNLNLRLTEAKRNIADFFYIGQLNKFKNFLRTLENKLNLPALPYKEEMVFATLVKQNSALKYETMSELSGKSDSILDELVSADEELYSYTANKFDWR